MKAAVIGAGPAGLMAAEILASGGASVTVFDHMPSPGRKLLMAGRGGLNLTHGEPLDRLLARYAPPSAALRRAIAAWPQDSLLSWCHGLGQPTFVGSSGRVFPTAMKSSPLLRAWLVRLGLLGVRLVARRHWTGFFADGALRFADGDPVAVEATVLACGGGSWPRLGSDGSWVIALPGAPIAPLAPANCGFRIAWSTPFRAKFAGSPIKRITLAFGAATARGELLVTDHGLEGGALYALSGAIRDAIAARGPVTVLVDLRPDLEAGELGHRLLGKRGGQSLSTFLRKAGGLSPVAIGLVQEALHLGEPGDDLAALVKAVPLRLLGPQSMERAISTAGGLRFDGLDDGLMLRDRPGVFAAGEMLDFDAPTGGYLLQAAFSTGAAAGAGALAWMRRGQ